MKKTFVKIISIMIIAALTLTLLCSCTGKKKTFTVGFDSEFPPYGYVDENGEYTGFDIELAKEVAKRNGWEINLKAIDWNSKDFQLESGAIDCIWNGFTMNGRLDDYTWSKAYVDNSQVVVTTAESGITKLADLAGKTVAVQTGSSAESVLTSTEENDVMLALAATFKELKQYADYNSAFLALQSGAVDAIAMDIGVAKYQIESRKSGIILDEYLATEQYGIGFFLGNTELCDEVSKTLKKLMEDGTFTNIAKQFGVDDSIIIWD